MGARYENYLMSEGERIWYWRNRMENERWFYEMYIFDRILMREWRLTAGRHVCPPG